MTYSEWRKKDSEKVMVEWRGEIYIGIIQQVAPEYSNEIVFLCKSFYPKPNFEDALRDSNIVNLYADGELNLTGRYHLLRRDGDELKSLTSEQREYMNKFMTRIYELMVDDEILGL
ncbi:MAG TPA: hypothetical protein EYP30_08525 [Archaeoglobaceae archaeon]|nr:hypothetical protein [Archaeoglobaceae archaeon]